MISGELETHIKLTLYNEFNQDNKALYRLDKQEYHQREFDYVEKEFRAISFLKEKEGRTLPEILEKRKDPQKPPRAVA